MIHEKNIYQLNYISMKMLNPCKYSIKYITKSIILHFLSVMLTVDLTLIFFANHPQFFLPAVSGTTIWNSLFVCILIEVISFLHKVSGSRIQTFCIEKDSKMDAI